jgi:tRNA(Ile)-lysidine synthase
MDLSARFVDHVRKQELLPAGARVLVACSGGADSSALAVLVAEQAAGLGLESVVLAHLDHGLRPGSAEEQDRVASLARRLGAGFTGERRTVTRNPDESPEAAARRVRYGFLEDAARVHGATHVVTAHHADDQAETVLQRILRGTGPHGLRGIPTTRSLASGPSLVRPLLPFRRVALRELLTLRGISWVEDPTNVDGNLRARLRHQALPVLANCVGRDPVPLLARLAANIAASAVPDDDTIAAAFLELGPDSVVLHRGFERLPQTLRAAALRAALPDVRGGAPLTRDEVERLLGALDGTADTQVAGLAVEATPGAWLVRASTAPPPAPRERPLDVPGTTRLWDELRLEVTIRDACNAVFLERLACRDGTLEIADADALSGALRARARREGDRIQPFGAGSSTRLGHLLQRRGIAADVRDRLPLICDAEGIVWAVGACLANRVRVTPATRRVATLRVTAPLPR